MDDSELNYEWIGRSRLPGGLSYPLQRSTLEDFLRRERLTGVGGVGFCGVSKERRIIKADFYGARSKSMRPTLNLWTYAVPSGLRARVGELILQEAFPRLAGWIRSFDDGTLLRSMTDHSIAFAIVEDKGGDRLGFPTDTGVVTLMHSS